MENVRGNILTFIDADDWIDVDCFENGVCIMDRDDLDILQYSYKMIREQDGCVISVRNYECVPLGWREFVRTDHYIVCVWGILFDLQLSKPIDYVLMRLFIWQKISFYYEGDEFIYPHCSDKRNLL